jgi:hypothetical protein
MRIVWLQSLISIVLCSSLFFLTHCSSSDDPAPVDCATSDLSVSFTATNPTACGANNGTITAAAAGGDGPYQFALDAKPFSSNANFTGLDAGIYQVKLKDKNGCEKSTSVTLTIPGSTLSATVVATANSGCTTSNGAITINATGGTEPYTYKINEGTAPSNTVSDLAAGNYSIKVTDNTGCSITQTVKVLSGIKLSVEIKTIIDANCAITGCHVAGGTAVSFATLSNVQSHASDIKTRTQSGNMPKDAAKLPQAQLDIIACWVDDGAPNN